MGDVLTDLETQRAAPPGPAPARPGELHDAETLHDDWRGQARLFATTREWATEALAAVGRSDTRGLTTVSGHIRALLFGSAGTSPRKVALRSYRT